MMWTQEKQVWLESHSAQHSRGAKMSHMTLSPQVVGLDLLWCDVAQGKFVSGTERRDPRMECGESNFASLTSLSFVDTLGSKKTRKQIRNGRSSGRIGLGDLHREGKE